MKIILKTSNLSNDVITALHTEEELVEVINSIQLGNSAGNANDGNEVTKNKKANIYMSYKKVLRIWQTRISKNKYLKWQDFLVKSSLLEKLGTQLSCVFLMLVVGDVIQGIFSCHHRD